MSTYEEKIDRIKDLLLEAQTKRDQRLRRRSSQEEWARAMRISPSSLSEWMRGIRLPEGENIIKLSRDPDVGLVVYDVLEMPRPVTDPLLQDILKHLDELPLEEQRKIADQVRQMAETNRAKKRKSIGGAEGAGA